MKLIKKDVIEKNLIKTMNEKLTDVFQMINEIIVKKVEPEKLNITFAESDLADVRKSSILGSASYLLSNLTGAKGPLSLNTIVNLLTNDTGLVSLKQLYKDGYSGEYLFPGYDGAVKAMKNRIRLERLL